MQKNFEILWISYTLASRLYKFLDKNTALLADNSDSKETGINSNVFFKNKELAKELQKPIIKKFWKWNVQLPFIDNIWATDLSILK